MNFSKHLLLCFALFVTSASIRVGEANAQPSASAPNVGAVNAQPAEPPYRQGLGAGYKIGNGLGFVGADIVFGLSDQFSLGLQANNLDSTDEAGSKITGFGVVPFVEYRFGKSGSTLYVSGGLIHARLKLDDVTASGTGGFANIGWQWRWHSGLAIHVGAGIGYLASVSATDGINTIEREGGVVPNIESGLRYFFF